MSLVFPPRELLGKFDMNSEGKLVAKDGIQLTKKEQELLEQYQRDIEESSKHRYEIESV